MLSAFLGLILFAQTSSGLGGGSTAGSATGGRPQECIGLDGAQGANVWERAKAPALWKYCDLLASGSSKLAGTVMIADGASADPRRVQNLKDVLAVADEADRTVAGKAAPSVLRGRAFARLGDFPQAYAALHDAKERDERALEDPVALLAWGRVALRTGHLAEAAAAYRALLPRASALPTADRGVAYIEAGMMAMGRGAGDLDEAIQIFRQARRDSQDVAQTVAVLALALALDRSGERDEARAVLSERIHTDPHGVLSDARARQILGPASGEAELDALAALALEPLDANLARESWKKYLEKSPPAVWTEHARAHEAALGGAKGGKHK
jgi:tetratricopeptide (TPR) repeat protein